MRNKHNLEGATFFLSLVVAASIPVMVLISGTGSEKGSLRESAGTSKVPAIIEEECSDPIPQPGTVESSVNPSVPEPDIPALLLRAAEHTLPEGEEASRKICPPVCLPGRVIDAQGRPQADMTVTVCFSGLGEEYPTVRTDEAGRFLFEGHIDTWYDVESHSLFLSAADGARAGVAELYFCKEEEESTLVRTYFPDLFVYTANYAYTDTADHPVITVVPAGSLRGSVTNQDGLPLAGIPVVLSVDRNLVKPILLVTGADGTYHAAGLLPGLWEVSLETQDQWEWVEHLPEPAKVPVISGSEALASPLCQYQGKHILAGRVEDRRGRPVPDGKVRLVPLFLHRAQGSAAMTCRIGEDGCFELTGIPAGDYVVLAGRDDNLRRISRPSVSVPGPRLSIRLENEASLEGRVVDQETGLPIPAFQLRATAKDNGQDLERRIEAFGTWRRQMMEDPYGDLKIEGASTFTDRRGRFSLKVSGPGAWQIEVFAPGFEFFSQEAAVDSRGVSEPLTMLLVPLDPGQFDPATEEEETGDPEVSDEEDMEETEEAPTLEETEGNVQTEEARLTILLTGRDGHPLPRQEIRVYDRSQPFLGSEELTWGPDGIVDDLEVDPGLYRIYGYTDPALPFLAGRVAMTEAQVGAGEYRTVHLTPPAGPATLVGELHVDGFTPETGEVCALNVNGQILSRGSIDDGGRFVMTDMPPGRVLLKIDVAYCYRPTIETTFAFREVTLLRTGVLKFRFDIEQNGSCPGRIQGMPVGVVPKIFAFPSTLSEETLSKLDDILRLTAMSIPLCQMEGADTFFFFPIAAGEYRLGAFYSATGSRYEGKYDWASPAWCGFRRTMPLHLSSACEESIPCMEYTIDTTGFRFQTGGEIGGETE